MGDHCAVEFFTCSHTSSQLEELNGVCSVCYRLITLCTHLSRPFQGVVFLPVLLAWCLFHQHERCFFQSTHQIMCHRDLTPWGIVSRIVIPGHDIHLFRPFEVIQILEGSHQVCRDHNVFVVFADRISLHLVTFQNTVRIKSAIIDGNTCKCGFLGSDSFA